MYLFLFLLIIFINQQKSTAVAIICSNRKSHRIAKQESEFNKMQNSPRFTKIIQGTFHQADLRFGTGRGIQCATNSLVTLCWAKIKRQSVWNSNDLDDILTYGDAMYNQIASQLPTFRTLDVDDLRGKQIEIEGHIFQAEFIAELTGDIREGLFVQKFYELLEITHLVT